tara:strand:- start:234 stop:629 length:396 start_codon:yes stop_codon:yes gene_type:complete
MISDIIYLLIFVVFILISYLLTNNVIVTNIKRGESNLINKLDKIQYDLNLITEQLNKASANFDLINETHNQHSNLIKAHGDFVNEKHNAHFKKLDGEITETRRTVDHIDNVIIGKPKNWVKKISGFYELTK